MQIIPDNCYDELAIKALQKSRNERNPLDVFYMSKYFRQYKFFNGYNDEIIKNCCSKMRYEILNIGQLIYKRFDQTEDPQHKFYIILQGELGVYLSIGVLHENIKDVEFNEVCTIKTYEHFGQQLFLMNKDDIHEHFGLIIKPKKLTYVATLSYQYFNAYLLLPEQRKMNQDINLLYEYCLFKDLQYKELKVVFQYIKENLCQLLLNIVFRQGDGAFCVYFIVSGQYQLQKKRENKENQILGILSEGEIIGEYEILNNYEQRPFTMTCVSEKGEIIICDRQFFLDYVYELIKENLEQAVEAKFNFHQLDKTSIKQELTKLNQFVKQRQSIDDVCKQNKFHYQMRPVKKKTTQSISEYKGKQSYYDLFLNIFNIASQKNQLTNDIRHRRITQYVKYTLKPMQQKLKSCINLSANKTDESIGKTNPMQNEVLIQALKRKPDSRLRKTFHKSLASLNHSKKISRAEIQPNFDLGENLIIKKQYKSNIHFEKLQRPDLLYSRNQNAINQCVQILTKDPTIRLENDNEKLGQLLRNHDYFRFSDNEYLIECCQLMKFEQFQKNQIIFQKNQLDQNKLIVILSGDIVLNKGTQEMAHLKHFGTNLLIFGSEGYSDIPDWNVTSKTNCKVAAISKHDFKLNLMTQEVSRITKEISILYAFPVFKNVPYAKVRKFYANSVPQSYQCLDIVYLQEQMVKQVFLVINGIFELRELEKGVAKAVYIFTQGQFIGDNEITNESNLRNGTAFCISEEGQLLMFDSDYFLEQVMPSIQDNLPKTWKTQVTKNEKFINNKISLTGEIKAKRSISRQYNFRRSLEETNKIEQKSKINKIKSTHSVQSIHKSQSVNSEEQNDSQINNPSTQIIHKSPQQIKQRLNQRPSLKSTHISMEAQLQQQLQQQPTQVQQILSPQKPIINRYHSFQQSLQQLREEAAIKKQQQQMNLRMPLKNELLNKFLNRKEEYGDIAAKNRMRRTLSQSTNVKKPQQIIK